MRLPKLEAEEMGMMKELVVRPAVSQPFLTAQEAAEVIRRVELHEELVDALDVELKEAEEDMAENGLPFIQVRIDRLKAILAKSKGA